MTFAVIGRDYSEVGGLRSELGSELYLVASFVDAPGRVWTAGCRKKTTSKITE